MRVGSGRRRRQSFRCNRATIHLPDWTFLQRTTGQRRHFGSPSRFTRWTFRKKLRFTRAGMTFLFSRLTQIKTLVVFTSTLPRVTRYNGNIRSFAVFSPKTERFSNPGVALSTFHLPAGDVACFSREPYCGCCSCTTAFVSTVVPLQRKWHLCTFANSSHCPYSMCGRLVSRVEWVDLLASIKSQAGQNEAAASAARKAARSKAVAAQERAKVRYSICKIVPCHYHSCLLLVRGWGWFEESCKYCNCSTCCNQPCPGRKGRLPIECNLPLFDDRNGSNI